MCPTSQTLSLKRIGRGFHFGLFAACLVCVRCKFGISRVLSFCFHPGDPPRPPPPLAREILEQGSDWKHVSRKRQPERRASVLLGPRSSACAALETTKEEIYIKENSALLSILDYSLPRGNVFCPSLFPAVQVRAQHTRALMRVVFACTVIAQKCKNPSLSMPIRTRVSVNPPCKK